MRRAIISERLGNAFEQCVEQVVHQYGNGSRRAKLRLARRFLGMTQKEFASAFGLSPVTVRNWEADSRTDPSGPGGAFIDLIVADPLAALNLAKLAKVSNEIIADVALEKDPALSDDSDDAHSAKKTELAAPYISRRKAEHI